VDLDQNSYPDLLVGSYADNKVGTMWTWIRTPTLTS